MLDVPLKGCYTTSSLSFYKYVFSSQRCFSNAPVHLRIVLNMRQIFAHYLVISSNVKVFNVIQGHDEQRSSVVWRHSSSSVYLVLSSKQPHSIVQRRLLEGNITRLRGEARDAGARVRSPLADTKDGQADAEERSESTADDSTEERESLEESERSLRSDEEDDSSEAAASRAAGRAELTALVVQCKVPTRWNLLIFCVKIESKRTKRERGCALRDSSRWEALYLRLAATICRLEQNNKKLATTKAGPH